MYADEPDTLRNLFASFAKSKVGNNYTIIDINYLGLSEEKQMKKILAHPMEEVKSNLILINFVK